MAAGEEEKAPEAQEDVAPATSLTGLLCSLQRCCVCRKKGATVACRQKRCSRRFHLPCSSQRGCISQFFGKYSSFCWEHRPQQTVETLQEGHTTCIICMEVVEDSLSYTTMVCPSCKHAWFHRGCIQGQALRTGLRHFACPHCRDWERFVPEMLQMGICVPNKKPAWEQEEELALPQLHGRCDARQCLYRGGREQWQEEGPWQLLLCSSCAASGTHRRCSGLADTTQQWECAGCAGPGTGTAPSSSPSPPERRAGRGRVLPQRHSPYSRPQP
ncbi:PHD finger protein 7-like [Anas platyrhynchos]|uniref:PHD finger protein 7-like n=1 Tax=Anas platyrhynchos TaxID=8839 RepID=UPI003AF2B23B